MSHVITMIKARRWLILRRISQLSIMFLFLLGPLFDYWILKGNLSSSLFLDKIPMSDPYLLLQSWLAGHDLFKTALIGGLIIFSLYFLIGGRVYCSWVCPLNIVTDLAAWIREKLNIKGKKRQFSPNRFIRYWVLALTLLLSMVSGVLVWETINPVSLLHRGILFGMGIGWLVILFIFLFDIFISPRGWCGHLCPVGAFYSLIGFFSLVKVNAVNRQQCDDCMDCYAVCPEPQVLKPALKGEKNGITPLIASGNCTNCFRCIDVCSVNVFKMGLRFNK